MVFRYKNGDRPLDGYTVQRGVGSGGFGEVYYALSDGGRQVALKCLQHNQDIELRGVGQCMNLKSPYLVTIFDVKRANDGMACVLMEYVAGPSFREILQESPAGLGVPKAVWLIREIAKGLGYLHERGIVHRDLKPENIFFEDGYVKIGDYGLSKYISLSRQSCQTISVGTVHYMAPEIGSGRYHRGMDIYALGIILYEMLAGRVPFTGDSFGEILMKHLTLDPDVSVLPAPFAEIVRKALRKSPEERYGKVEEMIADLTAIPEVEAALREFRPETISRPGRKADEPAPETIVLPRAPGASPAPGETAPVPPPAAGPRAAPPPFPPPGSPRPSSPERPAPGAGSPFTRPALDPRQERIQKGILTAMSALGMSVAITLLGRSPDAAMTFGSFLVILGGALAVLVGEREVPGRFTWEPGIPRRLLTICIASPLYLLFTQIIWQNHNSGELKGSIIALIASTAVVNWNLRTRRDRFPRIDLGLAFWAGLAGFIAAAIFNGGLRENWAFVPGCLAAISLVVNVQAAFEPRGARARTPSPHPAPAAGGPSPPPPAPAGWQAMPAPAGAGSAVTSDPMAAGARPLAIWVRVLALATAASLLALGLTLFVVGMMAMRGDDQLAFASMGIISIGFAPIAFRVGTAPAWIGFWTLTRWCLLASCLAAATGAGLSLAMFRLRGDEQIMAIVILIFSLVFGLFLKLLPSRLAKYSRRGRPPDDPPTAGSGWASVGSLLVTLGITVVLGTSILMTGIGGFPKAVPDIRDFHASGMHLLAGILLFLPGIFCILKSRRHRGAAYVLRGAIGFTGAALLVYILSFMIPEKLRLNGGMHFAPVGSSELEWLFALGLVSALFLFWPAKSSLPARMP